MGRDLLLKTLPDIINGNINPIKQDLDEVTFGYNISKEDELINFNASSRQVFNQVRGLNSWPVGYTIINGKRMKIYSVVISNNNYANVEPSYITNIYKNGIGVKTSDGEVIITELQMEGKNKVLASSMVNNLDKNIIGTKLGE
jgi:methionyl-tRNA formyltransferase